MSQTGMSIDISKQRNQVIIQFQEPVSWLGLSPEQAIEFAYAIFENAKRLENGDKVVLPGMH